MKYACIGRCILLASGFLLAGTSVAAEPEDIIKYRQNVMKSNGAHMAAAAAIINGKVNFKNQLSDHAKALQAINKDINSLFPKDSDFGDTKALDAVWQKNADFQKSAKIAAQKADALAKTVAAGDSKSYAARFKELSDSCKGCHKDYRKEEK
jgi:cytochrome c556